MTALIALPCMLARAIPSLQYLAVGDMAPDRDVLGVPSGDPAIDALRMDKDIVSKCDELRRLYYIGKHCWWRIVDGPHGRELTEILEEEGEEAQRQIECVNEDTVHIGLPRPSEYRLIHDPETVVSGNFVHDLGSLEDERMSFTQVLAPELRTPIVPTSQTSHSEVLTGVSATRARR
ncbi:hypothetical protein C8T65DRAFT_770691 [Cerioporus squamosus]|nr:hypothetical protein C8T65DRAFT_770691 [Cerioporus squamosus]